MDVVHGWHDAPHQQRHLTRLSLTRRGDRQGKGEVVVGKPDGRGRRGSLCLPAHREGRIAWGVNAPETGLNVLRGIRRPDCQQHFKSEPGLVGVGDLNLTHRICLSSPPPSGLCSSLGAPLDRTRPPSPVALRPAQREASPRPRHQRKADQFRCAASPTSLSRPLGYDAEQSRPCASAPWRAAERTARSRRRRGLSRRAGGMDTPKPPHTRISRTTKHGSMPCFGGAAPQILICKT